MMGKVDPFDKGPIEKNVGRRLTALRLTTRLNQTAFAERIGLTQSGVSNFETGGRLVPIEVAMVICQEFTVTLDWIYFGDPATIVPHDLYQQIREKEAKIVAKGGNDPDELIQEPPDEPGQKAKGKSPKKRKNPKN